MKENLDAAFLKLSGNLGKDKIFQDEILSKHTTWRVGGPASIFVIADSLRDLRIIKETALDYDIKLFVIGKGSNVLVSDDGYLGIVVKLQRDFSKFVVQEDKIIAGAGVTLARLVLAAYQNGLAGLAFASGIPGSLGGALVLNAGAFGSSISKVVNSVTIYSKKGYLEEIRREDIKFGYRESSLEKAGIVVEAALKLTKEEMLKIKVEMEKFFRQRKESQPVSVPTAGSLFKNPKGYAAGDLIERAGLKGFKIGGAKVSEKHANFIENLNDAGAQDIYDLLKEIQKRVSKKENIILEPEVNLIGEFENGLQTKNTNQESK